MRATALKGVGPGLSSPGEYFRALETFWNEVKDLAGNEA